MIELMIDTFENTTPAVNQKFEKQKLRQVPVTVSPSQTFNQSIKDLGYAILLQDV